MPRVVHFEIHAEDPERAITFYEKVFGWKFNKWEGPIEYWLVATGEEKEPGINGGLIRRKAKPPADGAGLNSYVCTIGVPSVDEYIGKIKDCGGKVVVSKTPIPGVGWFADSRDTEGNLFSIMEEDSSAR